MIISTGIKRFLEWHRVVYCPITHEPSRDLFEVARSLGIFEGEILQAIPLTDDFNTLLAVLPLNQDIHYPSLNEKYRTTFDLMSSENANKIFWDCEPGCYPPFGSPYRLKVILDKKIETLKFIYFVGGSEHTLVKISLEDFRFLNGGAPFVAFSYPHAFPLEKPLHFDADMHI